MNKKYDKIYKNLFKYQTLSDLDFLGLMTEFKKPDRRSLENPANRGIGITIASEKLKNYYFYDMELNLTLNLWEQEVCLYPDSSNRYNFIIMVGRNPANKKSKGFPLVDDNYQISFNQVSISIPKGFKHYYLGEYGTKFVVSQNSNVAAAVGLLK